MEPGDRLPSISLERVEGDGAVNLRQSGRDATVIVRLPVSDAARFRPYLERLTDAAPDFRNWNGRLLAVLGTAPEDKPKPDASEVPAREGPDEADELPTEGGGDDDDGLLPPVGGGREGRGWTERPLSIPVLRDAARATRDWAPADEAAVIVADRFGVVYHEAHGHSDADLPAADQLVEWLRFLATQCPECGVPDEPGLGEFA